MLTAAFFAILLVAVVGGVHLIHKAVCELRDQVAQTRHDLLKEIEKRG